MLLINKLSSIRDIYLVYKQNMALTKEGRKFLKFVDQRLSKYYDGTITNSYDLLADISTTIQESLMDAGLQLNVIDEEEDEDTSADITDLVNKLPLPPVSLYSSI